MQDAVDELLSELHTAVDAAAPPAGAASPVLYDMNNVLSTVTFRIILNVSFCAQLSPAQRLHFAVDMEHFIRELLVETMGLQHRRYLAPFGIRAKFWKHRNAVECVARDLVQRRLAEPAGARKEGPADLLDSILDIEADNLVGSVSQACQFAIAGSHTGNATMTWFIYYARIDARVRALILAEVDAVLPSVHDRLRFEDIARLTTYLTKVWKEALRLNPPAVIAGRQATREVRLKGSGIVVPRNSTVLAFNWASHRCADDWDEPERFIPERWGSADAPGEGDSVRAGAYAPFSLGPRKCVGQFMAEYEGVVILAELFRRFTFTLACEPGEVLPRSACVQSGCYSSKRDGVYDMGIPMRVARR